MQIQTSRSLGSDPHRCCALVLITHQESIILHQRKFPNQLIQSECVDALVGSYSVVFSKDNLQWPPPKIYHIHPREVWFLWISPKGSNQSLHTESTSSLRKIPPILRGCSGSRGRGYRYDQFATLIKGAAWLGKKAFWTDVFSLIFRRKSWSFSTRELCRIELRHIANTCKKSQIYPDPELISSFTLSIQIHHTQLLFASPLLGLISHHKKLVLGTMNRSIWATNKNLQLYPITWNPGWLPTIYIR